MGNPTRQAYLLVGCTASGKSAVANELARRTGALVLSADSMLVYRGMDVGTAKPTPAECAGVALRGIDLADPDEPFSAGAWLCAARDAFDEAERNGRAVIVAGGTGLYVSALLRGIDAPPADPALRAALLAELDADGPAALVARAEALRPGSTAAIDTRNPRRLVRLVEVLTRTHAEGAETVAHAESAEGAEKAEPMLVGLAFSTDELAARIERRTRAMFGGGLLEEAAALRARHPGLTESTAGAGIGYAEAFAVLDGDLSVDEAVARTALRTRRLAKRQRTWWRHQARVEWVPGPVDETDVARAADAVQRLWRTHGPATVSL